MKLLFETVFFVTILLRMVHKIKILGTLPFVIITIIFRHKRTTSTLFCNNNKLLRQTNICLILL